MYIYTFFWQLFHDSTRLPLFFNGVKKDTSEWIRNDYRLDDKSIEKL